MSDRPNPAGMLKLIVELGVIILGVLTSLAGESWWGQRVDRGLEREYLQDLRGEMSATDSALTFAISADSAMAAEVLALQEVLMSDGPPPADSAWVRGVYNVAFEEVSMETGTLNALFQTGDIRLIRSREVRVQLGSLQARLVSHLPILRSLEELTYAQYQEARRQIYLGEEDRVTSLARLRESAD